MDTIEREYEYKPSWIGIILIGGLFALSSAFLVSKAVHNDRGLIINGIIRLGPEAATVFYWFLATFATGMVALVASQVYRRLVYQPRLAFGPKAMMMPASTWSAEESEIAYRDIRELSVVSGSGQRFLYVTHIGGKRRIAASMLPSKAAFDDIHELLAAKVREAQAAVELHP